jgi:3-phenylpropionate/trans-cinnamate dioxygenase ferredoxin subunit
MNTKLKIRKSDIKSNTARSFSIAGVKVVVCNVSGAFYAVEDICSHDDGELVNGEGKLIESCQLECPRHGARFDVKTGMATKMPAVAPIKTFKIVDSGDELEVKIEE